MEEHLEEAYLRAEHAYVVHKLKRLTVEFAEFIQDKERNLFWFGWTDGFCYISLCHEHENKCMQEEQSIKRSIKHLLLFFHPDKNADKREEAHTAFITLMYLIEKNDVKTIQVLYNDSEEQRWISIRDIHNTKLALGTIKEELQKYKNSILYNQKEWDKAYMTSHCLKHHIFHHILKLQIDCLYYVFPSLYILLPQNAQDLLAANAFQENRSNNDQLYDIYRNLLQLQKKVKVCKYYFELVENIPGSSVYDFWDTI